MEWKEDFIQRKAFFCSAVGWLYPNAFFSYDAAPLQEDHSPHADPLRQTVCLARPRRKTSPEHAGRRSEARSQLLQAGMLERRVRGVRDLRWGDFGFTRFPKRRIVRPSLADIKK